MKKIYATELYNLCNKHQLFTCGTNKQYDKMFALVANGITQNELTYILYVCSSCRESHEIYDMLTPLFKDGGAQ